MNEVETARPSGSTPTLFPACLADGRLYHLAGDRGCMELEAIDR